MTFHLKSKPREVALIASMGCTKCRCGLSLLQFGNALCLMPQCRLCFRAFLQHCEFTRARVRAAVFSFNELPLRS